MANAPIEIARNVTLTVTTCKTCGVLHAIPVALLEGKRREGGFYFCPNGHQWGWSEGEREHEEKSVAALQSKNSKLQGEIRIAEARARQLEVDLKSKSNEIRRMNRRATAGTCQFCHRTFTQMARHMESKHPGQVGAAHASHDRGGVP